MKLAIIGGGNMGAAVAGALVKRRAAEAADLLIVEVDPLRRGRLEKELGCRTAAEIDQQLGGYEALLLAVKPQESAAVCASCAEHAAPRALVISIMAGITLQALQRRFAAEANVVRSMPNLPLQVGAGMTVYITAPGFDERLAAAVEEILAAGGACLRVKDESLLDAATAISGSGPGYVYYFAEQLSRAAEELGFTPEQAELLVRQTMHGALELWRGGSLTPAELRSKVTSKGGCTAAALEVFEKERLAQAVQAGIRRAHLRSRELSS